MFESKTQIQQQIASVYSLTENLDRGDVLTHEAIGQVLGVAPHEGSWDYVVGRVRRRLEDERKIATWHSILLGYRLLTTSEQIHVGEWRNRKAARQIRRGLRSVAALPEDDLTLNQCKAKAVMMQSLQDEQHSIRKNLRVQVALMHLRPVTPRRPERAGKRADS